jgi:uncharacterized membrane protein YhaH (DUF805 family)
MQIADLWRWDGVVGRKTYALVGLAAFAIKSLIDRAIGAYVLGYPQGILLSYWRPLGAAARLGHLSTSGAKYLAVMLLAALPFIWLGVGMTVKRLRDAGEPVWLVILFFIPFVNLPFLLLLCLLPSKPPRPQRVQAAPWPQVPPVDQMIPQSQMGSALVSIGLTSAIGLAFALLGTSVIGAYGWSLFVALPFCLGLFAVLLHSYHGPRDYGTCMSVALLPVAVVGMALLLVAIEGFICVLMAAPLALVLAWIGGSLGYYIQGNYWGAKTGSAMLSVVLLVMPTAFGLEHAAALETPVFVVRSAIDVQAPPEQVWKQVVAFAEIPPPTEMLFRAGIAYPIRAEIKGRGAGAVRRCVFSTGAFVEPIKVWDEPRLLRFGVTESPAPLNELTPYGHIEPRHLHGYFVSEEGQFLLTPLPGGGTRLEGTTRYRDAMWPAAYWHIWSDYIIHRIHMRVLTHIKSGAEALNAGVLGGTE